MSDEEMSVALLESLQRANPVPVDEVASRRDLPSAHALFGEITAQRPRRVRGRESERTCRHRAAGLLRGPEPDVTRDRHY